MAATVMRTNRTATPNEGTDSQKLPTSDALAARVREELGETWMPFIYRETILKMRTRAHKVEPARKGARVEVQHTLLGIELKVGRKRLSCPDLSTARYLAVFARCGSKEVAVPYDITRISQLADELESSWQRMLLLIEHYSNGRGSSFVARLRSRLVSEVLRELEEAGPGAAVPQFNQNTKQRGRLA